jgi:flagellar motor switch protein FliN/FliY
MDATAFALPEADGAEEGAWQPGNPNMRLLQEIDVRLSVEVGATSLKLRDLLALNEGSVVELDREAGALLDIFVNGTLLAKGEVVTVGGRFGVRVTDIVSPGDRMKGL